MNILFVNATKGWGGVKTWMVQLADFLSRRGHHIAIVCRPEDALINECARRNLTCYPAHFGMDFSIKTIWWFLNLFNGEQTDVVITNISKGIRTAGVAAKLKGLAHINRLGATGDLKHTLKTRLLYTLFVDKVFVPSQYLLKYFAQHDFLREKLRMFHNALTPPALSISQNSLVKFAIVAKLSKIKQVDKVLHVFHLLKDLPWELFVGGFGPELEPLQHLAQKLQLDQRVHFADKVDPQDFLQDKDVGILYSSLEGFPYSLLEYMGFSCAVIASDVGGIPEIVEHNVNGLLVDPHNPETLENAIRILINKPELREKFIREGYETIQRRFTQDIIFPAIEEEIQRTIAQVNR